jgi:hypothetical protein
LEVTDVARAGVWLLVLPGAETALWFVVVHPSRSERPPTPRMRAAKAIIRHCARHLGSSELLVGRTMKEPGPCEPKFHEHDHDDVIVMLRGSFTVHFDDQEVTHTHDS